MQFTLAALALVAATAVSAQGVTSILTPTASAPAGCSTNYAGSFEITVVLPSKKRDVAPVSSKAPAPSVRVESKLSCENFRLTIPSLDSVRLRHAPPTGPSLQSSAEGS
jgi:hypothetical protein